MASLDVPGRVEKLIATAASCLKDNKRADAKDALGADGFC